jgi:protein tyrosine phosphatase (PTP) superfamily phosphohydrolase (DUF442 family)
MRNRPAIFELLWLVAVGLASVATFAAKGSGVALAPTSNNNTIGVPLVSNHLHNLFRVTTNIFSGDSPVSDAAFLELAKLGVKTIISVDGSKPDVDSARKHGLRYIHLPFGYDGIPTNRIAELVKAGQSANGPIYVHCHHGLHRGPAAVAILCQASMGWSTNQALAWLKQAGTASDYTGLYRAVEDFRMPASSVLAEVTKLPEITKASSLVEAMVAIDEEYDRLKAAQKADWKGLPPAVNPVHSATILWEQFRELARQTDPKKRPSDYHHKLAAAEEVVLQLREALRDPESGKESRDGALQSVGKACVACHQQYRN